MAAWTARSTSSTVASTRKRGVRDRQSKDRTGTPSASVLAIPDWLKDVRELFPRETVEVLERHALERYGMTELVTDADVLKKMEPSYELLKAVFSFRHLMAPKVLEIARKLVRQVVEDLRSSTGPRGPARALGPAQPAARSPSKVSRNLDWQRTIRSNLKHYDREKKRLSSSHCTSSRGSSITFPGTSSWPSIAAAR